ncbi:MAG TPA: LptF/LptG family permease [Vicinamibacteria bacterium]
MRLRPTLLDRYVVREVIPPTAVGLLLFTFILLLDQIAQLMKILVSRGADPATVLRAFLYILPSIFSVTIPMAFLLGILLAFGRMASDSELIAMRAGGISPARLLRPVLALSAGAGLVTLYVVAVALPAANQAYRELVFSLLVSKARTEITPRVFNDDFIPGMVVYVSDMHAGSDDWRDVFLYDETDTRQPSVVLARLGRLEIDRERRTVVIRLQQGVLHTLTALDPSAYERLDFASRDFPLPFEQFFPNLPLAKGDREMSLRELRAKVAELRAQGRGRKDTGRFEVEFHKKFAIASACLVFGLLGLGLSLGSRKEARSAAFGLSLAVIFTYYVLIRLGEQAGDTGLASPALSMWAANIVLGAVAVALLVANHRAAAFDPLDPHLWARLLPRVRKRPGRPTPRPGAGSGRRLRIPRLRVPLPGLLDRYVAQTYVGKFALVLVSFWALFVLVNFMDLFDDVQQNRVKGVVVLHYYAFFSPQVVHLVTPVCVLVAVLITYGIMSRRNEITAMKAAGISIYRASAPALILGLLAALLMFSAAEYVLPAMNRVANRDFNVIKGRPPESGSRLDKRWLLGSDNRIYHYDYLEPRTGAPVMYGLSVYDVNPARWDLRDHLYAARATWNGVAYDLERGWRRTFGNTPTRPAFREFAESRTREIEAPGYFRQEQRSADTLRFGELRRHIATLEKLGLDVVSLQVKLHGKLAFPVVCLVMTLLGIPFAFVVARRGALYGIGVSVMIAIVYWAAVHIFEALGSHGVLPPMLAAWAPNLVFGAIGTYLTLMLET